MIVHLLEESQDRNKNLIQLKFFQSNKISLFLKCLTPKQRVGEINLYVVYNFNVAQLYFKYKKTFFVITSLIWLT